MFHRNPWLGIVIVGASALALPVQAQDATKEPAKPMTQSGPSTKKDASAQDCRDRMNTKKGEKRQDAPADSDTDKACGDPMKPGDAAKTSKKPGKTGSQSGDMPATPSDTKTNPSK